MSRMVGAIFLWLFLIAQTYLIASISGDMYHLIEQVKQTNYILYQMSQGKDV